MSLVDCEEFVSWFQGTCWNVTILGKEFKKVVF